MNCPETGDAPELAVIKKTTAEWKGVAEPYSIFEWMGGKEMAPLGEGRLKVSDIEKNYYDWEKHVILPLWDDAGGTFYGWLKDAHIIPSDKSEMKDLTGAGMVEADYEHLNLVVLKSNKEGWLQLQLTPGRDGSKWTHRCHLALGEARLEFEPWEAFVIKKGEWLQIRTGLHQPLMPEPSFNRRSDTLALLSPDQKFSLVVMKDDWIMIETRLQKDACATSISGVSNTNDKTAIQRGWIKWKDDFLGPTVWVSKGECEE